MHRLPTAIPPFGPIVPLIGRLRLRTCPPGKLPVSPATVLKLVAPFASALKRKVESVSLDPSTT